MENDTTRSNDTESTTAAREATADEQELAEAERHPVPKVWVASLSDYNAGRLHGAWVDVADEDSLWAGIRQVLATSPVPGAEEWAFHDYEGFSPVELGEYEAVEDVVRLAAGITEHGPAFAHFANLVGWRDAERLRHFDEAYEGHFEDLGAYGDYLIEAYDFESAIQELPELLIPYVRIEAAAFARDMELGGMIMTSEGDGGVYVFEEGW